MKKHLIPALFIFILLIAALLRLWQLGHVPPSPDWDEAALGYNAYSIMLTGKDEYGKFLPVVMRSFDDYKPALYSYFIIPFIPLMGLTIYAVRLPAVIFGLLAIIATFFLAKELLHKSSIELFNNQIKSDYVALLSMFFLAISPWHLQFSRIAFESQVGNAFNIFSALFLLKGLKNPVYLFLATFFLALNLYIYQSEKVFTPLLFFAFLLIYSKQIFKLPRKYLIGVVCLGIIISLPMLFYTATNKEALARAKGVSIFSDQTLIEKNTLRLIQDKKNNDLIGEIFDNRRVIYIQEVVSGYLSHFDLNWLFLKGDIARHHAPNMGLLYLWELPFIFIGIYQFLFSGFEKKTKYFVLSWFFIVPIPAMITSGVPHAVRTLNFLPLFQFFCAIGVMTAFRYFQRFKKTKFIWYSTIMIIFLLNFAYYLNQYFVQQNYYSSREWQYGYENAISAVKGIENRYNKIIVSNKPYLDQSYIFFLFYLKYNPASYQQEVQKASGGFRENHTFDKYEFRPIEWKNEVHDSHTLFVGRAQDIPEGVKIIKTIFFLDGTPAIKIAEG